MARTMPHVDGVDHQYITAGALRMHVALAGPRDAPPLLLLHGWPQHWYLWRNVIPAVAADHRVIAPDLRGFGWTDAPPGGYRKERMASDVLALLDTLGIDRVKLVGHDWGGWIGFLLALRAPERFERYLALNIAPPFVPPRSDSGALLAAARLWYQVVLAGPLGARFMRHGGTEIVWRAALRDPDAIDAAARAAFTDAFREPVRARASQLVYREFLLRELLPAMAGRYRSTRLTVPTYLLFGEEDDAVDPGVLEGARPFCDDLTIELVPGVGHFIVDERPDLVVARIKSFLG
ncbi:MAG: alpha/beta hydrolase [Solirubrobacteraceae bacterium]|nr:alpha/beta hydrolase [Solirubrobacteraceae bacterium]